MSRIERDICNHLLGHFGSPEKVEFWMTTTKRSGGGLTPEEMLDMGMVEDVLGMARQLTMSRVTVSCAAA